jgi:hypothetical protein
MPSQRQVGRPCAPWGATACRQFRNGEVIKPLELRALIDVVPLSILRTVDLDTGLP